MAHAKLNPDRNPAEEAIEKLRLQQEMLEEQLIEAQRMAIIGTLSAGVAHEINNILTPVLSYAHLSRSHEDDRELRAKAFDKIIAGVEAACGVAQAMLNYSVEHDEHAQAEVGEVVHAALGCLARDPAKDGIDVHIDIPLGTWVSIRPHALQQVLLNLILNASRVLHGKRGRIELVATTSGDKTTLKVADNGPGIDPQVLPSLFEPFVTTSSDQPTGSTGGGAGLGLMVSRHLIQSAGGEIEVQSTPSLGATFLITLSSVAAPKVAA